MNFSQRLENKTIKGVFYKSGSNLCETEYEITGEDVKIILELTDGTELEIWSNGLGGIGFVDGTVHTEKKE